MFRLLTVFAVSIATFALLRSVSIGEESGTVLVRGTVKIAKGSLQPGTESTDTAIETGSNVTVYAVNIRRKGVGSGIEDGRQWRMTLRKFAIDVSDRANAYNVTNKNGEFALHISSRAIKDGSVNSLMVVYGAFIIVDVVSLSQEMLRSGKADVVIDATAH